MDRDISHADAILQCRKDQNDAIRKRDFEKVGSFWTEDITVRRALGQAVQGKEACLDMLSSSSLITFERFPVEIIVSSRYPQAWESGRFEGRNTDGNLLVISGRYGAQWIRREKKWLIRSEVFVALEGSEEIDCVP